jgi:putative transcriptional regulator
MSALGKRLIEAGNRAVAHLDGKDVGYREESFVVPDAVDVKAIRKAVDMTQEEFAKVYGFNIAAVRSWEQGTRKPNRSSRILLKVIEKRPNIIREVFAEEAIGVKSPKAKFRGAKRAVA